MIRKIKKKILAFFEGYFVEILNNQKKAENELARTNEQIVRLENELAVQRQETCRALEQLKQETEYCSYIATECRSYITTELLQPALWGAASPRILICGFYGADNLGDELMLQTLLSYIPKDKQASITVMLCHNRGYDYLNLPGVNFIHIPQNLYELNLLAQCFDVLIWGGGAVIDDGNYDGDPLNFNNLVINLSKRFIACDKKVIALGVSTNTEITHPEYIKNLRFVCENSNYFSVRDKKSQALLCSLGIEKIEYLDDIVFYNKFLKQSGTPKEINEKTVIGLTWICYAETETLFKNLVAALKKKYDGNCIIKCICFYDYTHADSNYFTRLLETLEDKTNVEIIPYTNNIGDLVQEISKTDHMVNLRYHGMILSSLLGRDALNICYDIHRHYQNKVSYLAELLKTEDHIINFSDIRESFDESRVRFTAAQPYGVEDNKLEEVLLSALQL